MWDWLIWQLDWKFQAAILAIVLGVPILLLSFMLFGVKATLEKVALPLVGVLVVLGLASKLRQDGYRQRAAEDQKAVDRAEEIVDDKRDDVHKLPDEELDKRVDRWTPN